MANTADKHERASESLKRLDPQLQNRTRLGICVLLADADMLSFSRLRELLEETDGNLGASLRKLEECGYVTVKKEFVERKPVSWYALTKAGTTAVRGHLAALGSLIDGLKP